MAVEQIRGCGYRKVGGLYLCGGGAKMACDRLPYELETCPVCGSGVKFTRGFQWLNWDRFAGLHGGELTKCSCPLPCPVCWPHDKPLPYGLLWVGEAFYTLKSFIQEAIQIGVSRRIAAIPKNLKLGETWVLFAHKHAVRTGNISSAGEDEWAPGIFYAFRPQSLELLIWRSEATAEKHDELVKRGITPIIISDGDVDHDPRTNLKPGESEKNKLLFSNLRETVRKAGHEGDTNNTE